MYDMLSTPSSKAQAAPRRTRISAVLRTSGATVTVRGTSEALGIEPAAAAKLLSRWNAQGWIRRIRRGLYAPVPLAAGEGDPVIEDPWTLVPELFAPAYVGGMTAAHHWDLTEQIFRTVYVLTARPIRRKTLTVQGTPFVLRHIPNDKIFGTKDIWRGAAKVPVSDVHRTVIDMLDDPSCGGGIRHVADCLRAYLRRKDAEPDKLVSYADRLGNGAVFKRLGFLAEQIAPGSPVLEACRQRLTEGNVKLDPALPSPRLVRKWRLWLPNAWKAGRA